MPTRPLLVVIWSCFVIRALFYACAIPIWEGFDEFAHYARIEYLALEGREPSRDTPLPVDVADTFAHAPVKHNAMSIDQYWKLTAEERQRGFPALRETIYESQQPPLFYWTLAPLYRLLRGLSLESLLLLMRVVCVLAASLFIPVGFRIAQAICGSDASALAATTLMAVCPY